MELVRLLVSYARAAATKLENGAPMAIMAAVGVAKPSMNARNSEVR
jgi:hypothetical protein